MNIHFEVKHRAGDARIQVFRTRGRNSLATRHPSKLGELRTERVCDIASRIYLGTCLSRRFLLSAQLDFPYRRRIFIFSIYFPRDFSLNGNEIINFSQILVHVKFRNEDFMITAMEIKELMKK